MQEFTEYLLQFGRLTQQQLAAIAAKSTVLFLRKDDYFLEAGKITQQVGFLLAGVMRVCSYTTKGAEITQYFIDENHLVLDVRGLEYGRVPAEYVQAVTDCQLVVFTKSDWAEFSRSITGWDTIVHKIIAWTLTQKLEKILPMVAQDATTRYLAFIENYPQLANRIPLAYLASYLGITKSSLSRIRRNIR